MKYKELLKSVSAIGSPTVLVVGDFMLDVAIYGNAVRISPHAPIPVLKVRNKTYSPGGAGFVAIDVADMGGEALCIGLVGQDQSGKILRQMLDDKGVNTDGLIVADERPTIVKNRLVGLAQQKNYQDLIRFDEESDELVTEQLQKKILDTYAEKLVDCDIVCLQDHNKGLLEKSVCMKMIKLANKVGKKVLIDPYPGSDYSKYSRASVVTPNRPEAGLEVGFDVDSIEKAQVAAKQIRKQYKLDTVVITLDKQGCYLCGQGEGHYPILPKDVYDVSGAGDMVLASIAMSLAAGQGYDIAVQIGNLAAGIQVGKHGAASVTIDEIINEIVRQRQGRTGKVHMREELVSEIDYHRSTGEKIVMTNGCFDVLHRGHTEYLDFCKQQGDVLIVAMNTDESVREIKGPERPVNNQHDRAVVLASLGCVDYVTFFHESDPLNIITELKPDVLVKGEDWADKGVVGREFVESHGGKVVLAKLVAGKSSTSTIEKMKELENSDNG